MPFLISTDYDAVINADELNILTGNSAVTLAKAETMAISKIKHSLGRKYDTDAIFNATGDSRDETMIEYCIYFVLYLLYTKIAKSKVPEDRFIQYKDAKMFFDAVAKDTIDSNLPKKAATDTDDYVDFQFGSNTQYVTDY